MTLIESNGATTLVQVNSNFVMRDSAGVGPTLKVGGTAVASGDFSGWQPIGAEQTATGYEVAWKLTGGDQYLLWSTDANGNYTGSITPIVAGNDYRLENLEPSFHQDLNGDGTVGPVVTVMETIGGTSLATEGNGYFLLNGAGNGPSVKVAGATVTVGSFPGWTPIAAIKTATGYEIAWKMTGSDKYTVWNTDANGNFAGSPTGVVSGGEYSLQSLETTFGIDLNGDGTLGPVTTTIESAGSTRLVQEANAYFVLNSSGGGSSIKVGGVAVTTGAFSGWTPIAAAQKGTGFEVAWKMTGGDKYIVWNTDANGNFIGSPTGVVSGNDYGLELLEPSFGFDLNGDGITGLQVTLIESAGATRMVQAGSAYFMEDSNGDGPSLKVAGSAVMAGQFDGWNPIGAEKTDTGYEVAWKQAGTGLYLVWNTDNNGNYAGSATGVVPGADFKLEQLETAFQQDLNGDGKLSNTVLTTQSSVDLSGSSIPATIDLPGNTASASAGLDSPSLTFIGTPNSVVLGSGASTVQYSLTPSSGIETISNFQLGIDVLNLDLMGAAAGTLQAFDTSVNGQHAIALASSADTNHGVVLLNQPVGQLASDLLTNHAVSSGGHMLIG